MKVLLVYPEYPDTFWSFKHALRFVSRKAAFPPLGLLTVSAMLPKDWQRKLVDMNVHTLRDRDLEWADMVFISAMIVQKPSSLRVIERAHRLGRKVVVGGPLFTSGNPEDFPLVDHFVLGEGEVTLPEFLADLQKGTAQRIYQAGRRPAMVESPTPDWSLVRKRDYVTMSVQYSRGCPFNCEFCDIIIMNGRVPRTKEAEQLLREFETLYQWGWRGPVFVVDDNFIGNKAKVKAVLKEIIVWMKKRNYPFGLFTEASLNLAEDDELLDLMVEAGFNKVFIGLETPEEASLVECSKLQNTRRDQISLVRKIQNRGMEVLGGFIIGFDNDPPSIFENQISFIQNLGVVTAMVGLLNALPGTKLYTRLKQEGRLLFDSTGNNTDVALNFIPKMDKKTLVEGYTKVLEAIYSTKAYYERIYQFLEEYRPAPHHTRLLYTDLMAFLKSLWFLGVVNRGRRHYWTLLVKGFIKYRRALPVAITHAILGLHFQKVMRKYRTQSLQMEVQ